MDKELMARRFAKAAGSYGGEATVQRQIAAKMTALLDSHFRPGRCRTILEIGCGTGLFSRMLAGSLKPERMLLNDICPEMGEYLKDLLGERIRFESGDAETHPFDGQYDLLASSSAIQWFGDVGAFFRRTCSLLREGGILAFTTFGQDNIREVTSLTGRGLRYLSAGELIGKLPAGYDLLHASEEMLTDWFRSPEDVLRRLKRTGVTGIGRQQWTRADLTRFRDAYNARYRNGREVILTWHPIYIIARKK
jgi:malonyl-ACP O-methyltransferase BioC